MASSRAKPRAAARLRATVVLLALNVAAGLLTVQCANQPATPAAARPSPQLCVSGPMHSSDRFASVHGYITHSDWSEIWGVDPSHPANRISLGHSYLAPIAWSRDGSRLLLRTSATVDPSNSDLCVLNADGSLTRLTNDGVSYQGTFSADGTKVIFSRPRRVFQGTRRRMRRRPSVRGVAGHGTVGCWCTKA
jgi:hypothetical protein